MFSAFDRRAVGRKRSVRSAAFVFRENRADDGAVAFVRFQPAREQKKPPLRAGCPSRTGCPSAQKIVGRDFQNPRDPPRAHKGRPGGAFPPHSGRSSPPSCPQAPQASDPSSSLPSSALSGGGGKGEFRGEIPSVNSFFLLLPRRFPPGNFRGIFYRFLRRAKALLLSENENFVK